MKGYENRDLRAAYVIVGLMLMLAGCEDTASDSAKPLSASADETAEPSAVSSAAANSAPTAGASGQAQAATANASTAAMDAEFAAAGGSATQISSASQAATAEQGQGGSTATSSASAGATAAETEEPWPADCEQKIKFVAHAAADGATKYNVAGGNQYYASFYYKAPWGSNSVHGVEFRPITDNPKILHHWILYGTDDADVTDGSVKDDGNVFGAMLRGESFIVGWAPGALPVQLPDHVGMHMPEGPRAAFRLELHYNNAYPDTEQDASGVEFCVTSHKRTDEAGMHWLGTPNFSLPPKAVTNAESTCTPNITQNPAHILSIMPHMHLTGTHSRVILTRADGSELTLVDRPFDFNDQRAYAMPPEGMTGDDVLVHPGDRITTTCTFNNQTNKTIRFGEDTEDEMCFFFTLAWPRGQLAQNTDVTLDDLLSGRFIPPAVIPGAATEVNCLD